MKGVALNILPIKVNNQLSEKELITTSQIAALHIHVEHANSRIKIMRYLMISLITCPTKFNIFVCCMLTAFCSSALVDTVQYSDNVYRSRSSACA